VQARAAQLELEDRQREQRELRRRKAGGAAMEAQGEDEGESSHSMLTYADVCCRMLPYAGVR
jgi:hypothetical protein